MCPQSQKPPQVQRPNQAALAELRQRMLEHLAVPPEKQIPRIAEVQMPAGAGCARWYNI